MSTISPETRIGAVTLRVGDLEKAVRFYRRVVGLKLLSTFDGDARLGVGAEPLLTLHAAPGAPRVQGTAGLYHFAILLPTRKDLAASLLRIQDSGYPLEGAADHLVSEAIYLRDPEGNGIEISNDRPRAEWLDERGRMRMATLPLDLPELMNENPISADDLDGLPKAARVGHIHLHVSSLQNAERFYCDVLGFERVARYGASASFVSAGGYHHHIGLNTWAGEGAAPSPPDAAGLIRYQISLPDRDALEAVVQSVKASSIPYAETPQGVLLSDPSQNGIALTAGNPLA